MTAKIKLNAASGGGSISIQAPSSSSNNRVISLPDIADGTLLTSQSSIDSTKLSPAIAAGKILQFKYAQANSGNFSTSSQDGNGADVGGMTTSITLTSSSNKVLVVLSLNPYIGGTGAGRAALKLFRDTTMIYEETYANLRESDGTTKATRTSYVYLDNSADTSSHTYKVALKRESGSNTIYLFDEGANAHSISLYEVDVS